MAFFDNTPGKMLAGIKEWKLTDDAEIIDWLEGAIEQGNRVAHPELNKSLNTSLIDTYFINLPKIEKLFVEKFPNDNGLTDELRGMVQIYFQQSFTNRYTGEVYLVLKYKAIIENENYQRKNTKCDWIIDGKSEKDWVKDIEPNAKTNMFFVNIPQLRIL